MISFRYIVRALPDTAVTYEQLRSTVAGTSLRPLIDSLAESVHHPAIVAAILYVTPEVSLFNDYVLTILSISQWLFTNGVNDGTGLNESRSFACEIVAWQFLTFLSERDLIEFLLYQIPNQESGLGDAENGCVGGSSKQSRMKAADEQSPLLDYGDSPTPNPFEAPRKSTSGVPQHIYGPNDGMPHIVIEDDLRELFAGMNALEIAAVANAKKFLSQRVVQKVVENIWDGKVIFWESMSVHVAKKPQIYNQRYVPQGLVIVQHAYQHTRFSDPYARLRVPKYQKTFQAAFFVSFLALYYAVLVERNPRHISITEIFLYIWIGSFAYDEFGEVMDAGIMFYQTDFWSLWDLGIIGIGVAFLIARECW